MTSTTPVAPGRIVRRCALTILATTPTIHLLLTAGGRTPGGGGASTPDVPAARIDLVAPLTDVVRIVVIALLAYLWLAAVLNLAAVALPSRSSGPVRRLARIAPRWLAAASVGALTSASVLGGVAGAVEGSDPGSDEAVVMQLVDDAGDARHGARTMLPWAFVDGSDVPADAPADSTEDAPADAGATPEVGDPPRLEPVDPSQLPPPLVVERELGHDHLVVVGDSFWTIAERTVATRGLDVEVVDYWRLLVEANRSRLVRPGDPDLILPGQVLTLPLPEIRPHPPPNAFCPAVVTPKRHSCGTEAFGEGRWRSCGSWAE